MKNNQGVTNHGVRRVGGLEASQPTRLTPWLIAATKTSDPLVLLPINYHI